MPARGVSFLPATRKETNTKTGFVHFAGPPVSFKNIRPVNAASAFHADGVGVGIGGRGEKGGGEGRGRGGERRERRGKGGTAAPTTSLPLSLSLQRVGKGEASRCVDSGPIAWRTEEVFCVAVFLGGGVVMASVDISHVPLWTLAALCLLLLHTVTSLPNSTTTAVTGT